VLTNLIGGNAIKFTPKGGPVSMATGPAENDDWLSISVSDSGPGIPENERAQIFNEFYQISRPGEEKVKGVGLGLASSKRLVEMNGGKIGVQSNHGAGSTFTFTVPLYREDWTTTELHRGVRI
jgi:two-component system phosphate regulon sensor histidine kinase PhoR